LGGVMLADSDEATLAGSRLMMLFMDPPDHTRYRRLVSRGFTPRAARAWKERIDALAVRIVDKVAPVGSCDLVGEVAGEMPSLVIADLMGIPSDDGRRLYHLTEVMHSSDPALSVEDRIAAITEMHEYATSTATEKIARPGEDLATLLVHAEVDGERLSTDEFNWFFLLLVNAGGDTTRNLVAGGVEALLDHLGLERAAVGGVSLGANVALFLAARRPDRVQALVVEMPVLEWAVPAAAMTFVPLLLTVHFARRPARVVAAAFRRAPRSGFGPLDSMLNALSSDPVEIAAVLHGILAGPVAPTVAEREAITAPTLVIGHRSDRIHPFHDAEQLSRRLPHAQLVEASSMLELRVRPGRITSEIATFLDDAWAPPSARRHAGS